MTDLPGSAAVSPSEPRTRAGLRFRLWMGALGGVAVVASVVAWAVTSAPVLELETFLLRVLAGCGAGVLVAVLLAWWLDRGIVARVRRLERAVRTADAGVLQDPASSRAWGELGDLGPDVAAMIVRLRQSARAADQLQMLERQLEESQTVARRWLETERWPGAPAAVDPLQTLHELLDRGFARQDAIAEQNRAAARQVRDDLAAAIEDAREAAEQAERGFVEVTALLTTIRELQRLGQDVLARRSDAARPTWLAPVADAVRELGDASTESVEQLAGSLESVREIAEQANVLGNRATLVALNALLARRGAPDAEGEAAAAELKPLAREARAATDRVQELARDVQARVGAASARIKNVRERVAARLDAAGAPAAPPADPDAAHALERMREMVQDAAAKSERLSAAGERASRAADRLARKLDDDVRDLEGLVVRLSPPGAPASTASEPPLARLGVIPRPETRDDDRAHTERPRPAPHRPDLGADRP
jgi:methyl-accepting chemotaxis protein